ncbi:hypothetical protein [Nocardia colli]|uniref:hypothetical protein n=1 Tax=Nocardia colli TaxID=2545717 RepID=UPI0035D8788B
MNEIGVKDTITYTFSAGALLVSIAALVVSILLPLYLAKRAEDRAAIERRKEKLPPFFRKVKEFAVHYNTPGEGYVSNSEYYLSNEAAELGLPDLQKLLLELHHDLNEAGKMQEMSQNKHGQEGNTEVAALGQKIQHKLRDIHDMAERENELLHNQ